MTFAFDNSFSTFDKTGSVLRSHSLSVYSRKSESCTNYLCFRAKRAVNMQLLLRF